MTKHVGFLICADAPLNNPLEEQMRDVASRRGAELLRCSSIEEAAKKVGHKTGSSPNVTFVLLNEHEMTDVDLPHDIGRLQSIAGKGKVLILTIDGDDSPRALKCIKAGAADFIVWQLDSEGLGPLDEIAKNVERSMSGNPPFGILKEPKKLRKLIKHSNALSVFVTMPFYRRESARELGLSTYFEAYDQVIKPTLEHLGWTPIRGDEHLGCGNVGEQVRKEIKRRDLILAEVSEENVNVYYEIGFAEGIKKPVVLVKRYSASLRSDLEGRIHIPYGNRVELARRLICGLGKW